MRWTKAVTIGAVLVTAATAVPAGAATYDKTSPTSTGCSTKGLVDETRTVVASGVWNVRLRRSTGCNTAWAVVTRTDGKKCNSQSTCARVKITRVKPDNTSQIASRTQVSGTTSQYSLQFGAVVGARYTASASTVAGAKIGSSKTLRYNADGTWSLV